MKNDVLVKLTENNDPTSATLSVSSEGDSLITILKNNNFDYYELVFGKDQVGISRVANQNKKLWMVVPSKAEKDNEFSWFETKLIWCVKYSEGSMKKDANGIEAIIKKFIKHVELQVFS